MGKYLARGKVQGEAKRTRFAAWYWTLVGCLCILVSLLAYAAYIAHEIVTPVAYSDISLPAGRANDLLQGIATRSTEQLAVEFEHGSYGVLLLTPAELTVLARAENPAPSKFWNVVVEPGDGVLVLHARTHIGSYTTTISFTMSIGVTIQPFPTVKVGITRILVGTYDVPKQVYNEALPATSYTLAMENFLHSTQELTLLRNSLSCFRVSRKGLYIGFHTPNSPKVSDICTMPAYGG
ncbi:MAG: hypothetical protein ACP5OR_07615 [Candidatus Dormibacteria bacterium]